jgi:hypothetical protein
MDPASVACMRNLANGGRVSLLATFSAKVLLLFTCCMVDLLYMLIFRAENFITLANGTTCSFSAPPGSAVATTYRCLQAEICRVLKTGWGTKSMLGAATSSQIAAKACHPAGTR